MLTLDFDLEGEFELLSSHFEKVEGQLTVAIDRALRKLSNWFGSRLKREFAQALNLPKKILIRVFENHTILAVAKGK